MNSKRKYLVVVDIPSIKEYVFGTEKLVEIRGASALLKEINEDFICNFLLHSPKLTADKVFAGGGAGHFIVEAGKKDLEEALSTLKAYVSEESKGGFSLVCGFAEYLEDKYDESLRKALISLEQDKDENPFCYTLPIHTGFIRECESCSEEASIFKKYYNNDTDMHALCLVCARKIDYGQNKEKGLWKEFSNFMKKKNINCALPTDFEEIGNGCVAKKGYTALVYADGNDMGNIFQNISKREQYKIISNTVEQSIRTACMEAIVEICKPVNNVLPAAILLLGGDDLLVYLAADTAIPFAISVAKKFTEESNKRLKECDKSLLTGQFDNLNLTISLGISFGKSHTPFSIMLNQADELLKSAKKSRRNKIDNQNDKTNQPYIDYHLASNFNQIDVISSRLNHLTIEGHYHSQSDRRYLKLYQKPYSLSELEMLWNSANNLLKSGIPSTKLRQLGCAPALGKINGVLEYLRTFTRLNYDQRREIAEALRKFGCSNGEILWRKQNDDKYDSTALMDIVELTEFIKTP
ncbi:MAG: hypothetical protein HYV59_04005 [Planctomycetes bacterium]|nr:hypothetical protein [Planctomycetota bacterium]